MMIIDVRKLNVSGKYSGHLSFEYEAPQELIDIPFVKFAAPVRIEAEYVLFEDDSLELTGTVSYLLTGQCSRCLKDASQSVTGELNAYFQPKRDSEDYSYTGGVIDLTDAVNDAILGSMPRVLSCGPDCEGIRYHS